MSSPMQLSGKRDSRSSFTAAMTGKNKALFYVWDRQSKPNFIIDTGAEISELPATRLDRQKGQFAQILLAANGSKITTFGSRAVTIDLPQGKFKWTFVIANVAQPLLGADFLRAHSLLVDMKHQHLVNAQLFTSIPMEKAPAYQRNLMLWASNKMRSLNCWHSFRESQHRTFVRNLPNTKPCIITSPRDHPFMLALKDFLQAS